MSWFDEQIHHRDLSDQEIMEDSLLHIASSVLGRGRARKLRDKQTAAQDALEEILKYYGIKSSGIRKAITDLEDQLGRLEREMVPGLDGTSPCLSEG